MTLQRQVVSLPIGSGQSDDKARALVDGNELAFNMRFPRTGIAAKSYTMAVMAAGGLPGSTGPVVTVAEADGTVVAKTTKGTFTFDTVSDVWRETNTSAPVPSAVLIDPLVRGGDAIFNVDIAIVQDLMCVVYAKRTRSGDPSAVLTQPASVYATFFDIADGTLRPVSGPTLVSGILSGQVRVLGVETGSTTRRFTIIGKTQTNRLGYCDYTTSAGTYAFGSVVDFTGVYYTLAKQFGCTVNGGDVYVVFPTSAITGICHLKSDAVNTSLADASFALTCVFYDANGNRVICSNPNGVARLAAADLSGAFGSWTVGTWSITSPEIVAIARWGASRIALLLSSDAPSGAFTSTPHVWGTEVRVFESNGTFVYKTHLANTYIHGEPRYITAWGESAYFMRPGTEPRRGQALRMGDNAGGTASTCRSLALYSSAVFEAPGETQVGPAHTALDAAGALYFAYQVATGDTGAQGDVRADIVRIQAQAPPPSRSVSANSTRIFGDGNGATFAGAGYSAMLTLPRGDEPFLTTIFSLGVGANALVAPSQLFIRFAWVWVDQYGNQHRGAPTPYIGREAGALSSSLLGTVPAPYSNMVVVPLPPLAELTLLQERGGDLYLDVFEAAWDNPVAENFTARLKPTRSSTWLDAVVVYFSTGQSPDPDPERNMLGLSVYTLVGGTSPPWFEQELQAAQPAAIVDVTSTQSRLWALSAEKRNTVMPSKPISFGVAPEFATELEFSVPSEGGDCVGIAAIDDKIIVFKERRIFIVSGDPGDALGEGSSLQTPRMLSGDVGCVSAQSIVEGPFGVAFQSQRGFYTLGRGLELRFIGEKVQGATTGAFSGVLIPDQSEVRWLQATSLWLGSWVAAGALLTWDYLRDQWSTRECGTQTHQTVVGDGIYGGAASNGVVVEDRLDWTSATHLTALRSPWIKLNGVSGFQRIWRATFLLYHYSGHLRIQVAYDYDTGSALETHEWLESELSAMAYADGRVQVSLRPNYQKCAAIQFRISEFVSFGDGYENPVASYGQGHDIIAVDIEVGVKSGTVRRILQSSAKG